MVEYFMTTVFILFVILVNHDRSIFNDCFPILVEGEWSCKSETRQRSTRQDLIVNLSFNWKETILMLVNCHLSTGKKLFQLSAHNYSSGSYLLERYQSCCFQTCWLCGLSS
ncbi:hypothetical protein ACH5RR_017322 [Cinchona calisaya]|uniref:Secreted protein n=1 Tax=Cinchona calisaya TaxID=153742 RepID=A0ABD2ZYV0_9GENT